jgi:hypothetical protein
MLSEASRRTGTDQRTGTEATAPRTSRHKSAVSDSGTSASTYAYRSCSSTRVGSPRPDNRAAMAAARTPEAGTGQPPSPAITLSESSAWSSRNHARRPPRRPLFWASRKPPSSHTSGGRTTATRGDPSRQRTSRARRSLRDRLRDPDQPVGTGFAGGLRRRFDASTSVKGEGGQPCRSRRDGGPTPVQRRHRVITPGPSLGRASAPEADQRRPTVTNESRPSTTNPQVRAPNPYAFPPRGGGTARWGVSAHCRIQDCRTVSLG